MRKPIMTTKSKKYYDLPQFFELFDDFVNDAYTGRRTKKSGKRIERDTIYAYDNLRKHLEEFSMQTSFELKIFIDSHLTQEERIAANRYYKKFYMNFLNFLYDDKKCFDNYVGHLIKGIRCFFNYLLIDRQIPIGTYHKFFFVPKEEIPIVALTSDQLNFIICNESFQELIQTKKLERIRDVFVFGCSVALRVSDLLHLSAKNLIVKDGNYYLQVKSRKTAALTSIKLPRYCIDIIDKYKNEGHFLLPVMTAQYFNRKLKDLAKYFPDNYEYVKVRERRGKQVVVYKDPIKRLHFKLSDHITTHTMRRTAISVMLNLGMPEHVVRKISGHAPNSREFYRYVQLAQSTIDFESDRIFNKIGSKRKK